MTRPAGGSPTALERLVPLLRCPNCAAPVTATDTGVVCSAGHSFDRARQGYLTLFGPRGRRFPGDTPGQVAARERFLAGGWYEPIARAVEEGLRASSSSDGHPPTVAEFGAGTGYYLAAVLDRLAAAPTGSTSSADPSELRPLGVGAEISAPAARRLARAHPDLAAVVCDTWEPLPLADGCLDALTVVFAPRHPAEFARVLRPGGVAVVVTPGEGHLEPLRERIGMLDVEPGKDERLDADFYGWELLGVRSVDEPLALPRDAARDLVLMGPSGVHLDEATVEAALDDDVVPTRLHVTVRVFRTPLPRR